MVEKTLFEKGLAAVDKVSFEIPEIENGCADVKGWMNSMNKVLHLAQGDYHCMSIDRTQGIALAKELAKVFL